MKFTVLILWVIAFFVSIVNWIGGQETIPMYLFILAVLDIIVLSLADILKN